MFKAETSYGSIYYGENIIRRIVLRGIEETEGKLIPYNMNNKLVGLVGLKQVKKITPNENAIRIDQDETGGIFITVYAVVRFGTSINDITNKLIDYIYDNMKLMTDTIPIRVTVKVTGIMSRSLAKRDIEVSR